MTGRGTIKLLVATFVFLLALNCVGFSLPPVVLIFSLLVGWVPYIARVTPQVHLDAGAMFSAFICLLAVVVLAQIVGKWLWTESGTALRSAHPWRTRWTIVGVAIVVLMFVAGIAATGITHQTAWLARRDEPMFSYETRRRLISRCDDHVERIGYALKEFAEQHNGALPDSLAEILTDKSRMIADDFTCPSMRKYRVRYDDRPATSYDAANSSYAYLGAGLKLPIDPARPILCEPLADHGDGMTILFGDFKTRFVPASEAVRVMNRLPR